MANVVDTVAIKMVLDASGVQDGIGATTKEITEAGRIINSLKTPLERLEEKQAKLQDLFLKGAIDDIPKYHRALIAIQQQKDELNAATNREIEAEKKALAAQQAKEQQLKELAAAAEKEAAAERERLRIEEMANDLLRARRGLLTSLTKNQSAAERELAQAMRGTSQQMSILGDLIKFNLMVRGVYLVRDAFRELVQGVTDAGRRLDDIGDKASKLGISATALQALRIQANLSDVSFESLTGGMEKLMIRSADAAMGNMELQKTFGLLGIGMDELRSMTDADRFNRVAQALSAVTDRATKLNMISDLFGRGNTEVIMFIDNLSNMEGIVDRTKAVISNEEVALIEEADTAIKVMMASLEGVFNVAAVELAPVIKDIADELSRFLSQDVNGEGLRRALIIIRQDLYGIYVVAKDAAMFVSALIDAIQDSPVGVGQDDPYVQQRSQAARSARETERQSEFTRRRNLERFGVAELKVPDSLTGVEQLRQMELSKKASEEAERAAKAQQIVSDQTEQSFSKEADALKQQIELLTLSKDAVQQLKDERSGFNTEQQDYLAGLRDEKAALEAIKFAEEEDIKAKKQRLSEAENIRQSLQSAEDAAVGRLERAMDLVTTGELGQGEFDKLLEKEAKSFAKPGQDLKLSASAFGSQAAIAATLGRDQQNDSQRLESIKQSLLELVKKPSVEVAEVGAI